MEFEFHNPGPSRIDHVLHRPFGLVRIGPGEYVPTAEQEAQGLTVEFFEDLVPSFLRRTPPAVRRRLLEERGMEVPSDLIACTAHLAEFQQNAAPGGEAEPMAAAAAHGAGSERTAELTVSVAALGRTESVCNEEGSRSLHRKIWPRRNPGPLVTGRVELGGPQDRDGIYGEEFTARVDAMGIEEVVTAPRSPWQNPYAERVIGSVRRECLDHVIVLGEGHLRRTLRSYVNYYHQDRPHQSLDRRPSNGRDVELVESGRVDSLPRVGGLHHRYTRAA
jgi:hypothetical protein